MGVLNSSPIVRNGAPSGMELCAGGGPLVESGLRDIVSSNFVFTWHWCLWKSPCQVCSAQTWPLQDRSRVAWGTILRSDFLPYTYPCQRWHLSLCPLFCQTGYHRAVAPFFPNRLHK